MKRGISTYTNRQRLASSGNPWQLWIVGAALCLFGIYFLFLQQYSFLLALLVTAGLGILWRVKPNFAILCAFGFLLGLGEIRRLVSYAFGPPVLDPFLLVGTVFATCIAVPVLYRVRVSDALSKIVLALTCVMCIEIFNPRQGPISVGLSGALFYLTPLFWFWIGREYGQGNMLQALMFRLIVPAGILAAALGIAQTYIGFLPWEKDWIQRSLAAGYTALNLGGGNIRSFGFSSNGAEYGNLLMISGICMIAGILTGRRIYLLFLPLVLTGQLLASQRTPIIKIVFTAALLWSFRNTKGKMWILRLATILFFGLAALAYSSSHSNGDSDTKKSSADYATKHVTQGLSHPFDSKYSTAGTHTQMFRDGIVSGVLNPIGAGLGAVTLGSGKFGGGDPSVSGSSEVDISDAFITMGIFGGPLYLLTLILGLKYAYEFCRTTRHSLSFPLAGLLVSMLLVWIPLGQYAVGPIVWFCIGYLVRQTNANRAAAKAIVQQPQPA